MTLCYYEACFAHPRAAYFFKISKPFVCTSNFHLRTHTPCVIIAPGRQIWDPQLKEPNMITNFFKWIRSTFTPQYQEEIHQYLSTSTDLCDLENKMNHLIRGGWIV